MFAVRLSVCAFLCAMFLAEGAARAQTAALPEVALPYDTKTIKPRSAPTAPELPVGQSFLWIVSIGYINESHALGGHFCGGSVVGARWVLTAAHCVMTKSGASMTLIDPSKIQVKLGYELDQPVNQDPAKSFYKVEKIIPHPQYGMTVFNSLVNDIALLKLSTPLVGAQPASLVKPIDEGYLRENVIVIGWGQPGANKNYLSNRLRYLKLNRIDGVSCNSVNYYPGLVDDKMICALGNGTDACQGDSGGPLVALDAVNVPHLYGIVSWGDQCGESLKPGIYVRIPSFYTWIQTQLASQ